MTVFHVLLDRNLNLNTLLDRDVHQESKNGNEKERRAVVVGSGSTDDHGNDRSEKIHDHDDIR